MIVRIQGGGQYRLDGDARSELESIDTRLVAAVSRGDADEAHALLGRAIDVVQGSGTALSADDLSTSDLILPPADASLEETDALLRSEGLLA